MDQLEVANLVRCGGVRLCVRLAAVYGAVVVLPCVVLLRFGLDDEGERMLIFV